MERRLLPSPSETNPLPPAGPSPDTNSVANDTRQTSSNFKAQKLHLYTTVRTSGSSMGSERSAPVSGGALARARRGISIQMHSLVCPLA
eukprot:scaffold17914_cov31-Tisochrysis_lutea.AAC.7